MRWEEFGGEYELSNGKYQGAIYARRDFGARWGWSFGPLELDWETGNMVLGGAVEDGCACTLEQAMAAVERRFGAYVSADEPDCEEDPDEDLPW